MVFAKIRCDDVPMPADEGSFGEWLTNLRKAKGLTQKGIEDISGKRVSISTLSNLERGETDPATVTSATLAAIADGLKIEPRDVFEAAKRELPPWAAPGVYVPGAAAQAGELEVLSQIADDLASTAERLRSLVAQRRNPR